MKKQENKKFEFEKFEMVKLSNLKKFNGGTGSNNAIGDGHDDGNLTDLLKKVSGDKCTK